MKLIFDQNLSHRLVPLLQDAYPDCEHVRNVGLNQATDSRIWNYAKNNNYIIVSKDIDFYQRSLLLGYPPKIIWIKSGNCSTKTVAKILRIHRSKVEAFSNDATATFLILS